MNLDPRYPTIPLGDWIADLIDWMTSTFAGFFHFVQVFLTAIYDGISTSLSAPLYLIMIAIFAAIAWFAGSWRLALFTVIGFYLIRGMDLWEHSMQTITLVFMAVVLALLFAIPLGILASKVDGVSRVIRPILDFMQTMPAMVYLVPAITIFSVGIVPGAVATVIFAMPPGVRLTELALRQVDAELVEAGKSFGATAWRILWQIQVPVAMPTIMAGVNQVIMLALSMVVLAGMAGADGLGGDVVGSLATLNVSLGMSAGVAVVIIAIWLDRVSNGLSKGDRRKKRKRPTPQDHTPQDSTDGAATA